MTTIDSIGNIPTIQNGNVVNNQPKVNFRASAQVDNPVDSFDSELKKMKNKQRKQKVKEQFSMNKIATLLGIGVSAVFIAVLGGPYIGNKFADAKFKKALQKCTDETCKTAVMNEMSKETMLRSNKKINDLLTLGQLGNKALKPVDIDAAKKMLDDEIIGMEEVKKPVLEFLKEYNYNLKNGIKNTKPFVICLDGPPGVGKTTVGEVISRALDMHYKKVSLAGATGKAVIKGSEPVYTGATYGAIAEGQIEGKTKRVCYLLDEAEKTGTSDFNGRIEDTLLSIFDDQAQFVDDNLNVPIDLSKSVFVMTTNEFNKLSSPLQNRIKKISINAYDNKVKAEIAKLKLTKGLQKNKMGTDKVIVEPDVYSKIAEMTTDQGGRETTRNVDEIIRSLKCIFEDKKEKEPVVLNASFVEKYLINPNK